MSINVKNVKKLLKIEILPERINICIESMITLFPIKKNKKKSLNCKSF